MPSKVALNSKGITEVKVDTLFTAWLIYVAFFWYSLVIPLILPSVIADFSLASNLRFLKNLITFLILSVVML